MKICYINLTKEIPSRDAVYLRGLKENGAEVVEIMNSSPGLIKFWRIFKRHRIIRKNYDIALVGYTAHILVPFVRLISNKKIVFNALGSMYEGKIISRAQASSRSFKALYWWLIDFLAFHAATLSLVESNAQKKFLQNKFWLSERKLLRAWTGADDNIFFHDAAIPKLPIFTVLFRGRFLPEAGIEYAIETAKTLKNENIKFRIIGSGPTEIKIKELLGKYNLENVEWIKEKLSPADLRNKMLECHLSLGQLSIHDRLQRTVPHKAFETLAVGLPYLTARNPGIMELLKENETCFFCNPADSNDLAKKIIWARENQETIKKIAENGNLLHRRELRPAILAKKNLLKLGL